MEQVRHLPTIAFCSKSCSVRLLCSVLILFELVGPDVLLHVLFGVGLGTVFCSMFCSGQRALLCRIPIWTISWMISGFPLFVVVFGVLFGRQLGPLFCLLFCSGGDSGVHVVFEVLLSNGVFCSGDGNSNKTWAFGEHCSGYTLFLDAKTMHNHSEIIPKSNF